MMRALLIAVALAVAPSIVSAQTGSLEETIARVEETYSKLSDLKGEFTQSAFNKSLNQSIPATGVVYL